MFDKIKNYFERGMWSVERVRNVVGKVITKEQFTEITGEEYKE